MVRVPVSTAQRLGPSLNGIRRLVQSTLDARTYSRILYLLLALPLGVAEFAFLVTAISFGFSTAVTLIGIPVLVGARLCVALARRARAPGDRPADRGRDPKSVPGRSGGRALVGALRRPPGGSRDLEGPRVPAAPVPARNPQLLRDRGGARFRAAPAARAGLQAPRIAPPRFASWCRAAASATARARS